MNREADCCKGRRHGLGARIVLASMLLAACGNDRDALPEERWGAKKPVARCGDKLGSPTATAVRIEEGAQGAQRLVSASRLGGFAITADSVITVSNDVGAVRLRSAGSAIEVLDIADAVGVAPVPATYGSDVVFADVYQNRFVEVPGDGDVRVLDLAGGYRATSTPALTADEILLVGCSGDAYCSLLALPRRGGDVRVLARAGVGPVAERAGWVYFWDERARLSAIAVGGGDRRTLSAPVQLWAYDRLAIAGDHAIFVRHIPCHGGELVSLPLDGSTTEPTVLAPASVGRFAVWGGYVFYEMDHHAILRVPLQGGPAEEVIVDPAVMEDLQVNATGLYWHAGSWVRVLRAGYLP